jgi:hypothetical protein
MGDITSPIIWLYWIWSLILCLVSSTYCLIVENKGYFGNYTKYNRKQVQITVIKLFRSPIWTDNMGQCSLHWVIIAITKFWESVDVSMPTILLTTSEKLEYFCWECSLRKETLQSTCGERCIVRWLSYSLHFNVWECPHNSTK